MMVKKVMIILATFFASVFCARNLIDSKDDKVIVCYLNPVELYGEPTFKLDVMELSLCTHLIFQIAWVDTKNYTIGVDLLMHIGGDRDEQINSDLLSVIRQHHPHIKITMAVTIGIGGYSLNEPMLPPNQKTRDQFIQSALDHIQTIGFDGFDLYLARLPDTPDSTDDLYFLVQELKEAFLENDYTVTATFLSLHGLVSFTKELAKLNRYLDLLFIPTSNTFVSARKLDRTIAPLKSNNESNDISVEFVVKHLLAHGVKPARMVLLSSLYVHTYLLGDPDKEEIQTEGITAITFKQLIFYKEMCLNLTKGEKPWVTKWFEEFSAPYVRESNRLIFYEDPKSVVTKIKMVIDYGLKGFAIWGLQYDDLKGQCNLPNDTYSQFIDRFDKFKEEPNLLEKLKDLELPNVDTEEDLGTKPYGVLNNTLCFRTPELKPGPYPILRTVDRAITLAIEEKKILDALKPKKKTVRPYCIFWPQCTAPLSPRKPVTNSTNT